MSTRLRLAREFVLTWLVVSGFYERPTYTDFRVQAARRRYVANVAMDDRVHLQRAA